MEHKINSHVWVIVNNSLEYTLKNFGAIARCFFPTVSLIILGMLICFLPIFAIKPAGGSAGGALGLLLVCCAVGFCLIFKYFWSYLLALGGFIVMWKDIITKEPVLDIKTYTDEFSRRGREYAKYYLIMCGIILLIIPVGYVVYLLGFDIFGGDAISIAGFVAVVCTLIMVLIGAFFAVSLPAFVLNPRLNAGDSIKKSVNLISQNYMSTLGFVIYLGFLSSIISTLISLPVEFALIPPQFSGALSKESAQAVELLFSSLLNFFFTTPFCTIATVWWYLRVNGYRKAV